MIEIDQFRQLKNLSRVNLTHGFSFRPDGNMSFGFGEKDEVSENRHRFVSKLNMDPKKVVYMRPEHRSNVLLVDESHIGADLPKSDALITLNKGLPLALNAADCAPILVTNLQKEFLALIHGGRESTTRQIVKSTLGQLKELSSSDPSEFIVGIGPNICKDCFPHTYLDIPVDLGLEDHWPSHIKSDLGIVRSRVSKPDGEYFRLQPKTYNGFLFPDIVGYNIDQLISSGIRRDQIEVSPVCTADFARHKLSYSHVISLITENTPFKDEYKEGRFMSVVQI